MCHWFRGIVSTKMISKSIQACNFQLPVRIIKKYASYPDLQGEYISVALIKLSSADYIMLKEELNRTSGSVVDTAGYPFLEHTFKFLGDSTHRESKNFAVIYRINKSVIGLYKDGNTILFEKGSGNTRSL